MGRTLLVSATVLSSLALALSSSCGTIPPCGPPGFPPVSGFSPDAVYLSPGTARIFIPQPMVTGCQPAQPERAVVTVHDPRNMTPPSSLTLTSGGAFVGFDASVPGWYHVSVNFEPNLGIGQTDLLAASDRRTSFVELPESCDLVWPLSSGAFVCDTTIYRSGSTIPTPEIGRRVTVGQSVWEVHLDGTLQRREDTGSGDLAPTAAPLRVAAAPPPTDSGLPMDGGSQPPWLLVAATEDELFALSTQSGGLLLHYGVVDNAGTPEIQLLGSAPARDGGLFARDMLAYQPTGSVWLAIPDPSSLRPDPFPDTLVCRMRAARGQPLGFAPDAGCLQIRGQSVGVSEDGFWIWPETEGTLHFVQVDDAGARSRASIAVPSGATVDSPFAMPPGRVRGPPSFLVYGARTRLVPRFDGQEIIFDAFDPEQRSLFSGASAELVWLLPSGVPPRTLVFQRAPR